MRILYIDVDTLRADHLGAYGYARATSPNIDAIASEGIRFEACYASDAPCLPSRTALCTGRFGYRTGVVGHGGTAADPALDGSERGFWNAIGRTSLAGRLWRAGLHTATLSSFAQRHSAFHWHAGFLESASVGKMGMERADEVEALALDWLSRRGASDDWFLHVHYWDPHTPYRTPAEYGEPFARDELPAWLDEELRAEHWERPGPHGAQECMGFAPDPRQAELFPRQPQQIACMRDVRRMFDGYDTGIRFTDDSIGRLVAKLDEIGVLAETAIVVTADHGETLGELGVYCDHQTADEHTCRVPMIVRWPDLGAAGRGRVDSALHYQFDIAATLLELAGGRVPRLWDGVSRAAELRAGREAGREALILSQAAWTCQRSVRWDDWLFVDTRHDGYHDFPASQLFDLASDPHERRDLAASQSDRIAHARGVLERWERRMRDSLPGRPDPMQTVMSEGGPFHVRGELPRYLERLRQTGRGRWAERLRDRHPVEAGVG